jgi:carboxypeptidase C (cathepsin A)
MPYEYFNYSVNGGWNWTGGKQGYMNITGELARFMSANPDFRVFNAQGLYDLTTPCMAQVYTLEHLGIDTQLRSNIVLRYYLAGHQMYTSSDVIRQLHSDVAEFVTMPPK